MASAEDIRATISSYLDAVGGGTSAQIAAHYAADATLTDPADSAPVVGRPAIEAFYRRLDGVARRTEALTVRVAGKYAAFHFRVITETGDQTITIEPIDVMTFDDHARITSMRAFWSQDDVEIG